jgi:hypothetical protein
VSEYKDYNRVLEKLKPSYKDGALDPAFWQTKETGFFVVLWLVTKYFGKNPVSASSLGVMLSETKHLGDSSLRSE